MCKKIRGVLLDVVYCLLTHEAEPRLESLPPGQAEALLLLAVCSQSLRLCRRPGVKVLGT